jgi:mannose-1-phosphate guanylyltransferase
MGTKKATSLCKLKAVILVGGPGTRLQPLTFYLPKPIMPVLNRPFLEHTLAHLKQFGIEDVILAMNYLPDKIQEYFGSGERCGIRLTYCVEKEPMGTAGAVKNVAAYLDRPFIVLNGDDVFLEMNFYEVFAFHREKKAKATIFLTRVDNPSAFGVVETDKQKRVQRFIEKPPLGTETTNWINAGGYLIEPDVLEYIPAGQHYMFERGLFPGLLDAGEPVFGYPYRGYWLDMGTLAQYFSLNMDFLLARVSDPLVAHSRRDGISRGQNVVVHPSAAITAPAAIDRGCRIGRNVRLKGPLTIGRDCVIGDGASLENAVLWDKVNIGTNARLDNCIISSHVVIGDNQDITNRVVTPSESAPLSPHRKVIS